jgi:hypothetical protein
VQEDRGSNPAGSLFFFFLLFYGADHGELSIKLAFKLATIGRI